MNLPCAGLAIFSLVWIYFSRKITSFTVKDTEQFISSLTKNSLVALVSLVKMIVIETLSRSIIFWIRPLFESLILNCIERKLHSECFKLNYEEFNSEGAGILSNRLSRNSMAIKDGCSILIYDILGSIIQLCISFKILFKMIEYKLFLYYSGTLFLLFLIIFFCILKLKSIKRESQIIEDLKAKEMTELFENFFLTKVTLKNETNRLDKFFSSNAKLKFQAFTSLIKLLCEALILFISVFPLFISEEICKSIGIYLYHSNALAQSMKLLIKKLIKLESNRIEVLDMIKIKILENKNIELNQAEGLNNSNLNSTHFTTQETSYSKHNLYENLSSIDKEVHFSNNLNDNTVKRLFFNKKYQNSSPTESSENFMNKFIALQNEKNGNSFNFRQITIFINNQAILSNVSFDIKKGDRIALVGSNGSGKTTFLRFLLKFLKYQGYISKGFLTLDKREVSYIPQNSFLFRTVYQELMEYAEDENCMHAACKLFAFDQILQKLPNGYETKADTLSRSDCQMITIIQAYIKRSVLLLADEPTSGLDKEYEELVLSNILHSRNHDIKIISCHNSSHLHKFNRIFYFDKNTMKVF